MFQTGVWSVHLALTEAPRRKRLVVSSMSGSAGPQGQPIHSYFPPASAEGARGLDKSGLVNGIKSSG